MTARPTRQSAIGAVCIMELAVNAARRNRSRSQQRAA